MLDAWGFVSVLVKFWLYLGFIVTTGTAMIWVIFPKPLAPVTKKLRATILVASAVSLVATILSFLLRAIGLTGDVAGIADLEILSLLWQTQPGDVLLLRAVATVMLLTGAAMTRHGRWISLLGGLLGLVSFTQIGHVPALGQPALGLLLLLHLVLIAFWVGVLLPLHELCKRPACLVQAGRLGDQFGRLATFGVAALLVAGAIMAGVLVGGFERLLSTSYGNTLLLKVFLVGILLSLAILNKSRFVPAICCADKTAAERLALSIKLEAFVMVLIFLATAILTSVLPLPH